MRDLECVCFHSEQGAPTVGALGNDAHGLPPVKRSNAAMDENGRAMSIAFPCIMGTCIKQVIFRW